MSPPIPAIKAIIHGATSLLRAAADGGRTAAEGEGAGVAIRRSE